MFAFAKAASIITDDGRSKATGGAGAAARPAARGDGAEIERQVAADFLPYNEQEFAEVQRYSRLIRHALRTGKAVYEKKPDR